MAWESETQEDIAAAMKVLEERGPVLGRPLVETITSSRHKNMKELRVSSGKQRLRILFAFDPKRQAICLLGGDKSGQWERWYRDNIPLADDLYDAHLAELRESEEKRHG